MLLADVAAVQTMLEHVVAVDASAVVAFVVDESVAVESVAAATAVEHL